MNQILLPLCLAATWLIWGSTYLGIRFALESFPPFMLSGIRHVIAGVLMLLFMRMRNIPFPNWKQTVNAAFIGLLMLTVGNALVCVAEKKVASGAAALIVAATPILTVIVNLFFQVRAKRLEWMGLIVGLGGLILINYDQSLQAEPFATMLIFIACLSWALAGALMPRLDMPSGVASSTVQMLAGGLSALIISGIQGEQIGTVTTAAIGALAWLTICGSMVAYSAYVWLLKHARPALATSCCYVNPVVALLLGNLLAQEVLTPQLIGGAGITLAGVALMGLAARRGS
ncbi:drug/metabolite exporter YedA [Burkholderiaceae bacterium DAT-1]|nr:drug/metabolite exporter YedA [Burkholderiaceae bacterium DAT-1]